MLRLFMAKQSEQVALIDPLATVVEMLDFVLGFAADALAANTFI